MLSGAIGTRCDARRHNSAQSHDVLELIEQMSKLEDNPRPSNPMCPHRTPKIAVNKSTHHIHEHEATQEPRALQKSITTMHNGTILRPEPDFERILARKSPRSSFWMSPTMLTASGKGTGI